MNRILVKYQTLNSKSDNLSFEVFFLFFANFSCLTAVKASTLTTAPPWLPLHTTTNAAKLKFAKVCVSQKLFAYFLKSLPICRKTVLAKKS